MSTKAQRIAGWVLTGLVGLFMIGGSGIPKFFDFPQKDEMMARMGIPVSLLPALGVLEIAIATTGPFAETVEQLGGYYILELDNLDEAIAIAAQLPPVHKGTVEIRPIRDADDLPASKLSSEPPEALMIAAEHPGIRVGAVEVREAFYLASMVTAPLESN